MKDVLDLFKGAMPDIQDNYDQAPVENKKEEIKLGIVPDEKFEAFGDDTVEDLLEGLDIQNGGGNTPQPQPVPPTPPMDEAAFVVEEYLEDIVRGNSTIRAYACKTTPTLDTLVWEEITLQPSQTVYQSTCKLRVTYYMNDSNKGKVELPDGTYNCTVMRLEPNPNTYGYGYVFQSDEFISSAGQIMALDSAYYGAELGFIAGWDSQTMADVSAGVSAG